MAATRVEVRPTQLESWRQLHRLVTVRHPHFDWAFQPAEQRGLLGKQLDLGVAVLTFVRPAHLATELVHHELQSVTDTQQGSPRCRTRLSAGGASAS